MIAIPSPPSLSSCPSSASLGCERRLEALAVVGHLDDEPVGMELVEDLHAALPVGVRVAHGVRAGLGERELEIAQDLLRERLGAEPDEPGQGEPAERDVFRLGRNRQSDCLGAPVRVHQRRVFPSGFAR